MSKTKAKKTPRIAPELLAAGPSNGAKGGLDLSQKQQQLLREVSQQMQIAESQQKLTLTAILAGADLELDDCQNLRMTEDGVRLEWGPTE